MLQFRRGGGGGGVLAEVELGETKILWPGGVLYGGGETYENGSNPLKVRNSESKFILEIMTPIDTGLL